MLGVEGCEVDGCVCRRRVVVQVGVPREEERGIRASPEVLVEGIDTVPRQAPFEVLAL